MKFYENQPVYFVRDDGTTTHGTFGQSLDDDMAIIFYKKADKNIWKIVPIEWVHAEDTAKRVRASIANPNPYNFKQIFW